MKKFLTILLILPIASLAQVDKKATVFTKNLYKNLFKLQNNGFLFGHQDGLAYGLNADGTRWTFEDNRSDIKSVTGEHPSVAGWDFGRIEFDSLNDLDGVPFDLVRNQIIKHFQRGGVSTISWHSNNPTNPSKTTWDKVDSTIKYVFNNKNHLKTYKKWLDKVAVFAKSLKDPASGELIPIIFRPYHEHTGDWFWWGAAHCTPAEYKRFWHFTVDYLSRKKKVHNFLYAYSTDKFTSKEHYLERYPGDDVIDMVGFDIYHRNAPTSNEKFVNDTKQMVKWVSEIGNEKNKLTAITETGLEKVTEAEWWTQILQPIIKDSNLSYILVWRNGRSDHYYAPYPSQKSATDFIKFIENSNILLENKTKSLNLYNSTN